MIFNYKSIKENAVKITQSERGTFKKNVNGYVMVILTLKIIIIKKKTSQIEAYCEEVPL